MPMFFASSIGCAPEAEHPSDTGCHYQIAWTLNPHMIVGSSNPSRARLQHTKLVHTLQALGATVEQLPFVHGAFDSVFAKDNGIYFRDDDGLHTVLASPRHHERQIEQGPRGSALRSLGAEVTHGCDFEGGDIVMDSSRKVAFLGHGFRSTPRAASILETALGIPVIALQLVDPVFFHLDTALAVLEDGTALFCAEAFAPASVDALRASFELSIAIPALDASQFSLNFVNVGNTVVTGTASRATNEILRALGKEVIVLELDEFQRAGGSVACLLGRVHDLQGAAARRSVAA